MKWKQGDNYCNRLMLNSMKQFIHEMDDNTKLLTIHGQSGKIEFNWWTKTQTNSR